MWTLTLHHCTSIAEEYLYLGTYIPRKGNDAYLDCISLQIYI